MSLHLRTRRGDFVDIRKLPQKLSFHGQRQTSIWNMQCFCFRYDPPPLLPLLKLYRKYICFGRGWLGWKTLKTVGFLWWSSSLSWRNFSKWQESRFRADFCNQVFHKRQLSRPVLTEYFPKSLSYGSLTLLQCMMQS